MPANKIIGLFVIIGLLLYWQTSGTENSVLTLAAVAVIAAIIYVFKGQINLWWHQKFPPRMPKHIQRVLLDFYPYYNELNTVEQNRFQARMGIFKTDKEFITPEMPEVPDDIRHLMIASAVQVSFGRKKFLLPHWGVVVVYRNPFRSTQIQEYHIGETFIEDGVILLATDPYIKGLTKPKEGYDIGLHYMAKAMQYEDKISNKDFLFFNEENETSRETFLRTMSQIREREHVYEDAYAPLQPEDFFGLCVEHFFHAPVQFEALLPDTYNALKTLLNQDPQNASNPVIQQDVAYLK